ncbi:ureidoglycolate dehydrogenase [Pseudactinotalea sp. HY160]|uniref:ureidoglycolate dehydrogenase n=1 Tax=Pseudactinotalea sp. HY160 TaxID=2654490 RepID=UPI00128E376D|nr:ureidoglycolate dehydrogenase [Pseudactinotalea sp. HY160]MPV50993.1 ureidoglycolate dehydrogenase [Pseudactinotalea sp. HY160]
MRVSESRLHQLVAAKLTAAGLDPSDAGAVADVLTFADLRGIHSHGALRTEYYAERIAKGGITIHPDVRWERTGASSGVLHGDNGVGHALARRAMEEAIMLARECGVAVVGVRKMSHSGALSYYTEQAAAAGLVAVATCQSDPMVVPFGGSEVYYGTNPIAFSAPGVGTELISFDMATTVQAWGKVLSAQEAGEDIPDDWAVDERGRPTTDPDDVEALVPVAGPKGYGLAMMVDVLSGVLLGLPFGKDVTSMYADMRRGRDLGQLHIVIDPGRFTAAETFREMISKTRSELNGLRPAPGFDRVLFPGQDKELIRARYERDGIEIDDDILEYLESDVIHRNAFEQT